MKPADRTTEYCVVLKPLLVFYRGADHLVFNDLADDARRKRAALPIQRDRQR